MACGSVGMRSQVHPRDAHLLQKYADGPVVGEKKKTEQEHCMKNVLKCCYVVLSP